MRSPIISAVFPDVCRPGCAACCIAITISSALPNLPNGKLAGQACVNLGKDLRCTVYEERPKVCRDFQPCLESCGNSHEQALRLLGELETSTRPSREQSYFSEPQDRSYHQR